MKEKQNMGGLDRLARLLAGLALLAAGLAGALAAGWNGVAIVAGAVLVATAVTGICPGYVPFRIDTRGHRLESR